MLTAKLLHDASEKVGGPALPRRCPTANQIISSAFTSLFISMKEPEREPTLHTEAIRIFANTPLSGINANIVCNVGLSYQVENRFSQQVPLHYKIATALLVGIPSDETVKISAALLNNMAVWYSDNGDCGLSE